MATFTAMTATLQHHGAGLTWHETNAMARAAHAVRDGDRVWLIDPFEDQGALAAAAELGSPAGVIQLLDRHNRDGASIAQRLGVPHHKLPASLPGTPFTVITLVARPWWKEIALWSQADQTLIVPEAIGTGSYFGLGRAAGVHPMLRLVPPRAELGHLHPRALLTGHGPALETGADEALARALSSSRSDMPRLLTALPRMLRGS